MAIVRSLQSLRFLFILLIVASHANLVGLPPFDAGGDCGVAFFLILSGYVTMLSKGESLRTALFDYKSYLWHNIRKIYPLYFAGWLLAIVFHHNITFLLHALPSLVFIQSWIPDIDVYFGGNSVGWFVSTLSLAWLMLPLLYRLLQYKWTLPIVLALYVTYAIWLPEDKVNAWLYVFPPVRLVDFMLGMALCRVCDRYIHTWTWMAGMVGIVCALILYPLLPPQIHTAILFWPFLCMIIVSHSHLPSAIDRILHSPWLVALGNYTMPIYLLHHVIMTYIGYVILHFL